MATGTWREDLPRMVGKLEEEGEEKKKCSSVVVFIITY